MKRILIACGNGLRLQPVASKVKDYLNEHGVEASQPKPN